MTGRGNAFKKTRGCPTFVALLASHRGAVSPQALEEFGHHVTDSEFARLSFISFRYPPRTSKLLNPLRSSSFVGSAQGLLVR
jgi:hypothetical protein